MKKLLKIFLSVMFFFIIGCEYDDSSLVERMGNLEERVAKLETLCNQMNTNISSLQTIVSSLQQNDYIHSVEPFIEGGDTVGYTISFMKSESIIIYHGQNGADGKDVEQGSVGKNENMPIIGVQQNTDGVYYWTLDGEWLLDEAGNKIRAVGTDGKNGVTPQLKIEGEYWFVSYDNAATWFQLGKITGEAVQNGDSFFRSVTQDEMNVYFTLANGTVITIKKGAALSIEFAEADLVVMSPNSTREISYIVSSVTDSVRIEVLSSADIKAKVMTDDERALTGKIHVETSATIDEYSRVVVLVSNDEKVIMKTLTFEKEEIKVENEATMIASADGGEVELLYLSNVECEVIIPDSVNWISIAPTTRALEQRSVKLLLEENKGVSRETVVTLQNKDASLKLEYTISQNPSNDYLLALEREALIAIYNALDGDNWTYNDNWCSDKPVSEWYGIVTNDNGSVIELNLYEIKSGYIPDEIGALENLESLSCIDHNLSGKFPIDKLKGLKKLKSIRFRGIHWYGTGGFSGIFPDELWELTNLETLVLEHNNFTGELSNSIGNLTELKYLSLQDNQLKGELPYGLCALAKLTYINLLFNQFTGEIPVEFFNTDVWKDYWANVIPEHNGFGDLFFGSNNNFKLDNLVIPVKIWDNLYDINNQLVNFQNIYKSNQYTILYQYAPNDNYWEKMCEIYKYYNSKIEIIGWGSYWEPCSYSGIEEFVEKNNIEWINISGNYAYPTSSGIFDGVYRSYITVVDNNGYVVFSDYLTSRTKLTHFLNENLGGNMEEDTYFSSDYSQDGIVNTLQKHTKGEGIDIVLMGDAYSDRQIIDGTYKTDMEYLYNNLFTVEPYKSFKEYFNVYYVNAVSEVEGYEYSFHGSTALGGYFGGDMLVKGNDNAVFDYALNALSEEEMNEALIVVVMNSDNYAGTCYMYDPENSSDYGSGVSVSYCPKGGNEVEFAQLLHHEACGHGFAKLADEYAYEDMGAVPSDYVSQIKSQQSSWGWFKNIDFTNNPSATRWSHFINDTRYANEGLGAYEGGLTYWNGVWRPTENSIMNTNTGGFNAPSREAIYYRIHKLAYGNSWEYDYEEFVEWDARNRTVAAAMARSKSHKPTNYKPTHPPVIVNKSWKEVR